MIELGKYATEVLTSYAISLVMLGVLVWASLRRSTRVRAQLDAIERQIKGHTDG